MALELVCEEMGGSGLSQGLPQGNAQMCKAKAPAKERRAWR